MYKLFLETYLKAFIVFATVTERLLLKDPFLIRPKNVFNTAIEGINYNAVATDLDVKDLYEQPDFIIDKFINQLKKGYYHRIIYDIKKIEKDIEWYKLDILKQILNLFIEYLYKIGSDPARNYYKYIDEFYYKRKTIVNEFLNSYKEYPNGSKLDKYFRR